MRIHVRHLAIMMLFLSLVACLFSCDTGGSGGAVTTTAVDEVPGAPLSSTMLYQRERDGLSYCVRGHSGKATDLVIDAEYNGFPVTAIMERAFYGKKNLTSISIPDSVTSVGKDAFHGCVGLIRTEGGAQYVDRWVVGVGELDAVASLRSDTVGIVDAAFEGCSQLVSITLNESLRYIGEGAFVGCTSLSTIVVPEGNTSFCVVGNALYNKDMTCLIRYFGKDKSFTVPATVTAIAPSAFRDQKSLTTILFEEGSALVTLGESAFRGCTSLTEFSVPVGITRIGDAAFRDCTSLASFSYALESVCTAIGDEAFRGCTSLSTIRIPLGIVEIGHSAFADCTSLGAVHFGALTGWNVGHQDVPKSTVMNGALAAEALTKTYCSDAWICYYIP